MKKIGILGTKGSLHNPYRLSTAEFLSKVGANTGNLVFQYAVYEAIKNEKLVIGQDIPWNIGAIRDACSVLVVPSANFIREKFDLTTYVDFLEKCDLPLLFLGLGVQADDFSKKDFDLHPSIIRLIELLKFKAVGVGVRGVYTAEILNNYGFKDSVIIGCPSNFINTDDDLPEKLWSKWNMESVTLTTTGDEPWPKSISKQKAEKMLFKWAIENNGIYVQQSVEPLVGAVRKENPYSEFTGSADIHEKLRLALAPDLELIKFKRFMTSSVRVYSDVGQWMEDMSRFDLSIGLRLHGNMVPFQSGCPSIWVYHDARTKELIDTMALPSIALDEFIKISDYSSVKSNCNFDHMHYKKTRETLKARYQELLCNAEVSCSF